MAPTAAIRYVGPQTPPINVILTIVFATALPHRHDVDARSGVRTAKSRCRQRRLSYNVRVRPSLPGCKGPAVCITPSRLDRVSRVVLEDQPLSVVPPIPMYVPSSLRAVQSAHHRVPTSSRQPGLMYLPSAVVLTIEMSSRCRQHAGDRYRLDTYWSGSLWVRT